MAKQKRLNKNTIAFVTAMAVILTVAVAVLVIRQKAQRDPKVLADNARKYEASGEVEQLGKAAGLYNQAYRASEEREVSYLLDVARCLFKMGDMGNWRETLRKAHSKKPDDATLVTAALDGLWQIKEIQGVVQFNTDWRDFGEELTKLDADSTLGLVSRAYGLWSLGEEANLATADQCAQRAYELQPTDPRVALAYVEYLHRQVFDKVKKLPAGAEQSTEAERLGREVRTQARDIVGKALAEHPANVPLVTAGAAYAQEEWRTLRKAHRAAEAEAVYSQAVGMLERALQESPDSPELHLAMAQLLIMKLAVTGREMEDQAAGALAAEVDQHAARAVELDPAMYKAYTLRAEVKLIRPAGGGSTPALADFVAALEIYDAAREKTLTLRNLRALLTEGQRMLMLYRAFDRANDYWELAGRQEDSASQGRALEYEGRFLDDAATKLPDLALTDFMRGHVAVANRDLRGAIKSFEQANEKQPRAAWWIQSVEARSLPAEELARLYEQAGELGEALRYADLALRQYTQELGLTPPVTVICLEAGLLSQQLDQPRGCNQALELLDRFRADYADNLAMDAARGSVLARMGRKIQFNPDVQATPALLVWQIRLSLEQDDSEMAADLCRKLLDESTATEGQVADALRVYTAAMTKLGQREAGQAFLREFAPKAKGEAVKRLVDRLLVILSETDPQRRDELILQTIAANPDPAQQAKEYCEFYVQKGDPEKALTYVEQLRKLKPNDLETVDLEFRLRVQRGQFDRATALIAPLSQANEGRGNDGVGGATYRGTLALAKQDGEQAIREFRQAAQGLPKSAALQTSLARAYLMAGRVGEAVEAAKQAIEINPRGADAYGLLTNAYDDLANRSLGTEREEASQEALKYFNTLAQLVPTHPFVQQRRQRADEDAHPLAAIAEHEKLRAEKPQDAENLARLGELYIRAWTAPETGSDPQARNRLAEAADRFFETAGVNPELKALLAQGAAGFYSVSGQRDKGDAYLRKARDVQEGIKKVSLQLLLARFLESQHDFNNAEGEYQNAQALAMQAVMDPEQRQKVEQRVGMAFIGFYNRIRRPDKVVETCRWMIDRVPKQAEALRDIRLQLIDALLGAGQVSDAEQEVNELIRAYGEDAGTLGARVKLNLARNRRNEAERDLTAILQSNPEDASALMARGALNLQRARYEEARQDLTRAKSLVVPGTVDEARLRESLTRLYVRTGQLDLAVGERQAMLDNVTSQLAKAKATPTPNDAEVARLATQQQQVVSEMAQLLRKSNRDERAQQMISEYMERYPEEGAWPAQLGQLLEERADAAKQKKDPATANRDYVAAAGYYQRAAEKFGEKNPGGMVRAVAARMGVLVKADQGRDAVALFERAPFQPPPPMLRLAAAKAYWALGERDAAVGQWRQALWDAANANWGALTMVSADVRGALQPGDARRLYEELVRQGVEKLTGDAVPLQRLRIALAELLGTTEKPLDALPLLKEVLDKAAADGPERSVALLTKGLVCERARDYEGALGAYREVLQKNDSDLMALNNLAYLLVTAEGPGLPKPQEALKYAERLESLVADNATAANALDTVGWVYFKYGQTAEDKRAYLERAAAALAQSVEQAPDRTPGTYEHLARVYVELGRAADARRTATRGLDVAKQVNDQEQVNRLTDLLNTLH